MVSSPAAMMPIAGLDRMDCHRCPLPWDRGVIDAQDRWRDRGAKIFHGDKQRLADLEASGMTQANRSATAPGSATGEAIHCPAAELEQLSTLRGIRMSFDEPLSSG